MKRNFKRILAMLLALTLTISGWGFDAASVFAADYGTTEASDDPMEAETNSQVFFVSAATGKLISLDGIINNPISCETTYTEGDKVSNNALFTVYYGDGDTDASKGKTVVNFTNKATQTSWKADNTVYQMTKRTNPSGWESVIFEPQGDGTVCFRSCANGNYFTVEGNTIGLTQVAEGQSPSTNEKFVMYTEQAPKKVRKVTLSNVAGDSVDVSWEGLSHTLFSAYEVLYATEENGTYKSAGMTADTTFTVEDLSVNTQYFFKVRALTNGKEGVYSESKVCYTQTLANRKPAKPKNLKAEQQDSGIVLTWDAANSADKYKVYRAVSRFAEYQEIGETEELTFTDYSPNTDSKYNNYYKVQGINNSDSGKLSDPASLEISMFGSNTYIINETDDLHEVYDAAQTVFLKQYQDQFGDGRYTFAFKAGDYSSMEEDCYRVGYYTQYLGLGKTPYDVRIKNVRTPAVLANSNATCNFWVGIENMTIADTAGSSALDIESCFQWAVSQAAPARRLNVERTAIFNWDYPPDPYDAWASGGYVADTKFLKAAGSYPQQQYYYRNCEFNPDFVEPGIFGVNWNQVIQGSTGIDAARDTDNSGRLFNQGTDLMSGMGYTNWQSRGCTTVINDTEYIREKPFLFFDEVADAYKMFVPAKRENAVGTSWSESSMGEGQIIDVDANFYIANPNTDTAKTINDALAQGKNIIFQPGIYHVDRPIEVNEPDTILYGLGMATIIPDNEETAIKTADVDGLAICGLVLDAGTYSDTMLVMGEEGCNTTHADNPSVVQDVIFRVGGTGKLGRTGSCEVINSNNVIIDHTWIWRADHGDNTGWTENTANNGLIVNGDDVKVYGLFVEHFQEYDVLWRGENGSTYFVQNEKCYDPQDQDGWMSHAGTVKGYAAYKVANNVEHHYLVGIGVYDVFINTNGADINLENAIEVPDQPDVLVENACIVEIASSTGPAVGINNIVNNTAPGIRTGQDYITLADDYSNNSTINGGYAVQRLLNYSNGWGTSLPDYYEVIRQYGTTGNEPINADNTIKGTTTEEGMSPTDDADAEKNIKKDEKTKYTNDEYLTPELWNMTDELYEQKRIVCYEKWLKSQEKPEPTTEQPTTQDTTDIGFDLKVGDIFDVGNYRYQITALNGKSGTVKLIAVIKNKDTMTSATIPATVAKNTYTFTVTVVGKSAFKSAKKLKKVTFGKNVVTIGSSAFASCKKLKTIKFKNVKTVGKKAFTKCKKLKKVTIGAKVTKIQASAFANCKALKKVTIGKKVKTIQKKAFAKCKKITSITFGKNVKTIKAKAFANSAKLKKITFKGTKIKKFKANVFSKKVRATVAIKAKKKALKVVLKSLKRKK